MKEMWPKEVDKEDIILFNRIKDLLKTNFSYSENEADKMFKNFFDDMMSIVEEEYRGDHILNVFHHNEAWYTALRVHYRNLGGNEYMDWDAFKEQNSKL